ncbi:MAG: hypothetical protein JW829_03800 [Pirellulales bacterium]|nr:hypothetical protein [Pirellulales bacterium]
MHVGSRNRYDPSQPNCMRRKSYPKISILLAMRFAALCILGAVFGPGFAIAADGTSIHRGALVQIALPLTGTSAQATIDRIQRTVDGLLDPATRIDGTRPILLLELVPMESSKYGESCSFHAAHELAEYLTSPELAGTKCVAYLPQTIKGHGVLIAMACAEIYMAPDAEIGEAGIDEEGRATLRPIVRTGYEQIARAMRTIEEPIALGMVDPAIEVWKVQTEDGQTHFASKEKLETLRENHSFLGDPERLIAGGSLGIFEANKARSLGFVKALVSDRESLAAALNLPPTAVVENQALFGEVRPILMVLDGPITPRTVSQFSTMIGEQKARGTRWICVRINSQGGEIKDCLALADLFAKQDPAEVQTVAFVTVEAAGGAALVALACDQLVMRPESRIGGDGGAPLEPGQLAALRESIRSANGLAQGAKRDWSIPLAMLDPHLEIFRYKHKETGRERILSEAEKDELPDAAAWMKQDAALTVDGKPWELTAESAKKLGIAWQIADNVEILANFYHLEETPRVVKPNWALDLVQALASPGFAMMLLAIGFIGLYVELHAPGIGIGGFIASVAFLLFFWSNFLQGTADWLEVLLFVGGACFILLEIFVIPGFGIFGLGGGLMVIISLILASQTAGFLPHNTKDLIELRQSLTNLTVAGVLVIVAAMLLRHFLPQAPMFNRLLLNPPPPGEQEDIGCRETLADLSHLLGQIGTASTNLRPSGKGEFAGELIDVIADSDPIDRGHPIKVIHVQGTRILVRPADKASIPQ